MRRLIRQTIRGMGVLPHVGNHPGSFILLWLVGAAALAGAQRAGVIGAGVGVVVMLAVMGPFYFHGAYARAQQSDALEALKAFN